MTANKHHNLQTTSGRAQAKNVVSSWEIVTNDNALILTKNGNLADYHEIKSMKLTLANLDSWYYLYWSKKITTFIPRILENAE